MDDEAGVTELAKDTKQRSVVFKAHQAEYLERRAQAAGHSFNDEVRRMIEAEMHPEKVPPPQYVSVWLVDEDGWRHYKGAALQVDDYNEQLEVIRDHRTLLSVSLKMVQAYDTGEE